MIKQNPFSVYDFLGYLIPGSVLIYSYFIIDFIKENDQFKLNDFIKTFKNLEFEGVFFFIIIAYTVGHLISFMSAITVERYSNWRYNYPSKYLLDMKYGGFWESARNWKDVAWRIIIITILLPCVICDLFFGELLGFKMFYKKSLDSMLKDLIGYKSNRLLAKIGLHKIKDPERYLEGKTNGYDFHRIITHYAYENSKNHQSKMSNYVALYGFLRTLCLIFNLLTIYFVVRTILYSKINWENILITLILSGICYLAFMAFMKFYRRYTLEGLMIITIDENL